MSIICEIPRHQALFLARFFFSELAKRIFHFAYMPRHRSIPTFCPLSKNLIRESTIVVKLVLLSYLVDGSSKYNPTGDHMINYYCCPAFPTIVSGCCAHGDEENLSF